MHRDPELAHNRANLGNRLDRANLIIRQHHTHKAGLRRDGLEHSTCVDPTIGISDFHARRLVFGAKLNPEARKGAIAMIPKLYRAFVELDASLVEVNPLVLTGDGKVVALDAKVTLDESADYRHSNFA